MRSRARGQTWWNVHLCRRGGLLSKETARIRRVLSMWHGLPICRTQARGYRPPAIGLLNSPTSLHLSSIVQQCSELSQISPPAFWSTPFMLPFWREALSRSVCAAWRKWYPHREKRDSGRETRKEEGGRPSKGNSLTQQINPRVTRAESRSLMPKWKRLCTHEKKFSGNRFSPV
jgi:hypothetical protein